MKLLRISYLLFAVILFTTSCTRTNEQLLRAEQLIETSPDSAMTILNKYSYNKLSDKDKALYGLLYIQVRDKKLLSLEPDSFINFSLNYFQENHDDHERLGACYLYKGRKLKYAFQYEKAVELYIMAVEIKPNNEILCGRLNSDLADILLYQKDYPEALVRYKKALNCFQKSNKQSYIYYTQINIAKTYTQQTKYKIAQRHYQEVLQNAKDSMVLGFAFQNAGINYYIAQKFDTALLYLTKSICYPYNRNNMAIRYYFLSDLYYDLKEYDLSQQAATNSLKYTPDIVTQRECFRILANISNLKNDKIKLKLYLSKYQDFTDSLRNIDKQSNGSDVENVYLTKVEVSKSRNWIWYISVLAILIIVLAILSYIRKHRKGMQTIKTIEEKQLVKKKESVQEIVERTKEALHKSLKEKRIELTKKIKQNSPEGRREMILQLYDESVHFKNKQHFKNEMDNTLNNLYSKLETSYPKLKTKEKQWACLNMLDIPKDDCIQLLDFNTESFKKMRQRFAQKIGVDTVTNIDAVLKKILYDAT